MTFRAWIKKDNLEIVELEKECFKSPWKLDMLDSALAQYNFYGIVAESDGKIVGYIGSMYDSWDAEILNIAVKTEYRRQKIAQQLMSMTIAYFSENGKDKLFLEVRRSNEAAKTLYASLGFEPIGERKKYYENTEDAIVMAKCLRG